MRKLPAHKGLCLLGSPAQGSRRLVGRPGASHHVMLGLAHTGCPAWRTVLYDTSSSSALWSSQLPAYTGCSAQVRAVQQTSGA